MYKVELETKAMHAKVREDFTNMAKSPTRTFAFNQEKALVGAFSVITNLRMDFRLKLYYNKK